MDEEFLITSAVATGRDVGAVVGDGLVRLFLAIPAEMNPVLAEALRIEMVSVEVTRIRASEAELLADGVPIEVADAFKISAVCNALHRLKLAGLAASAGGPAV